jgi:SAM-dependent methyltransferase
VHAEAYEWVTRHATSEAVKVLDIGGRNINGTVRNLFPCADYTALDIAPGEGVDIVADAATWTPDRVYDVVVCTEVFEHTASWPQIIGTAFDALRPGGLFVATMAGPGRAPHSAVDGGWQLHPGEHYGNVDPDDLLKALDAAGFDAITVDQQHRPADVRCVATRPERG